MSAFAPVNYQALFRALPGNYLLLHPDGTIADNSDQHAAMSMLPRAESQGRNIFDAYPSDAASQRELAASHEKVRQTLAPDAMPLLRYDLERPAAQGGGSEERYWQLTHYPVLDGAGQLQYILQIPQDVTAQHRATMAAADADRALAEAETRTRFLLESLPVLIWTADAAGQRDYFNPRWLAFTGQELAQQTGQQWLSSVHPDDRDRVVAAWQRCLQSDDPYQIEYRLRRHDGQYRWVLVRAQPRYAADGKTVSMWAGGAIDVHEQRQLVQELLEANEQQAALSEQAHALYRTSEAQRESYHSLFMQAPALIALTRGPEHRVSLANPPFEAEFGGRPLLGRSMADIFPELAGQGIIELLDGVYSTGQAYQSHEQHVQLRKAGTGPLHDQYFNLVYKRYEEDGQPAGIMVFALEVTAAVHARQELERLRGGQ